MYCVAALSAPLRIERPSSIVMDVIAFTNIGAALIAACSAALLRLNIKSFTCCC